ncbi:MAG: hypothetical protein E6G06_21825 [Actinobacteria bacterium]|nr:MAG: hypothetical protein E6G06_21825 [Actinomycetota bacterium]
MPVDTSAQPSDTLDPAVPAARHTGNGNRAGARRHAALDPTTDARPSTIALAERERAAIELRTADCTYQQIADALGYQSAAGARSAVIRGLGRWMREGDQDLRTLELARTDEIGQCLWPLIHSGNPQVVIPAVATYMRLLDYRAKITGLYTVKPPQPEVLAPVAPTYESPILAEVHEFMVLTNQIREQNSVIDVEPVEAESPS